MQPQKNLEIIKTLREREREREKREREKRERERERERVFFVCCIMIYQLIKKRQF